MSRRQKTAGEIADLIERFLSNQLTYPQEWNDFTDCSQQDPCLDALRKQCEMVSAQFEPGHESLDSREARDTDATEQLKSIAVRLRELER